MHVQGRRCASLLAIPVVIGAAAVTKVRDADTVGALVIAGIQNRTGADLYYAYAMSAPADTSTMILLTSGQAFMSGIGEGMPVGNLYAYSAAGGTVHPIEGR